MITVSHAPFIPQTIEWAWPLNFPNSVFQTIILFKLKFKFADHLRNYFDPNIFVNGRSNKAITEDMKFHAKLGHIVNGFNTNRLSLNFAKIHCMLFKSKSPDTDVTPSLFNLVTVPPILN